MGFLAGVKLRKMVGFAQVDPSQGSGGRVNQAIAKMMFRFRRISVKTIDNEILARIPQRVRAVGGVVSGAHTRP